LQQVFSFPIKYRVHIIMQRYSKIFGTNWRVMWDCVVQQKFFKGEKHNIHHFQSTSTIYILRFPLWQRRITF
jgi:hypothetical protein